MKVISPGNESPIETLYAFCSEDERGYHGIISEIINDRHFPLVTASRINLPIMERVAKRVGERSNMKVVLMRFHRTGLPEVIHRPVPQQSNEASS